VTLLLFLHGNTVLAVQAISLGDGTEVKGVLNGRTSLARGMVTQKGREFRTGSGVNQ
jgi:hypothetical protein